MGLDSLQVCMNTSDWLQGVVDEERPMDSSSPSGDVITCSRPPMLERRLRPPHDQALKCPRCDSTHTKFCYYNNYSLSQPRYFCKTCRRYWTKGGTLRNIPVGGGCRKNKRVATKKSTDQPLHPNPLSSCHDPTDLHLSFPEIQLSHLTTILGSHRNLGNPNFMESKYNAAMLDNHTRPIGFMESQLDAVLENSRNQDFIGSSDHLGFVGGLGDVNHGLTPSNFHGFISPFEMNSGAFTDTCQRLMLPFGGCDDQNEIEVKPNNKLLSLDNWQDQGCSEVGKDSLGYLNGLGLWSGV